MNKRRFEKELREKLDGMSFAEREKVLEYYDELYHEKLEKGELENDIIRGFGTPEEIAHRISSGSSVSDDYVGEREDTIEEGSFSEYKETSKTPPEESRDYNDMSLFMRAAQKAKAAAGGVFSNKTFWIVYFSLFFVTIPLTIALFSLVFSLLLAAFFLVLAFSVCAFLFVVIGPVLAVYGGVLSFSYLAPGLVHIGAGLLLMLLGIALIESMELLNRLRILVFAKKVNRNKKESPRKAPRFVSIGCVVLLIAGVVGTGAGWAVAGFDINNMDTLAYTAYVESGEETISGIDIKVNVRGVEIIKSTEGWRVETFNPEDTKLTAVAEDGVLKIVDETSTSFNFWKHINLFAWLWWDKANIKIYVPDSVETVTAVTDVGSFRIDGFTTKSMNIKVTTGSISVKNCTAETLEAKTITGAVSINNTDAKIINAVTTTGSVSIDDCTADTLETNTTTGGVSIRRCAVLSLKARVTTGSVNVNLIGNKDEYDIKSSTITGSNNAGNQDRPGDKKIVLTSTTGSVSLSWN